MAGTVTLYLVRHDRVHAPGICYGQTDLASEVPYAETANRLRAQLPAQPDVIVTSPLQRCAKLAQAIYPANPVQADDRWQEVNFGTWEGQRWDDLPRDAIDAWAQTPTDFEFPEGESLHAFRERVTSALNELPQDQTVVVITHAGVIRLCRALLLGQSWQQELSTPVHYASISRLTLKT
ncbi:alpha-ribazole phosphatase family protein [Reinekea blandensis]|uniref:Phosphoglycerate mutase n=1 Tax=Reinekea blandensis MED297 TaxID=314283 RepID=A4BIB3_9GAMM|nr:alpha-ribazole phosphatase family protein [Reinekea blandensis]EAR08120.1 phosphoglycerate mutase [Reinekea sp. MED297] [Reinekea blandensis MED297]